MGFYEDQIKAAQQQAAYTKQDYTARGVNAAREVDSVYKTLVGETSTLNTGINKTIADAAAASQEGAQSLIDSIIKSNTAAKMGVKNTLSSAGIVGVGQEGMDESLGVSETNARDLGAARASGWGTIGTAQKALGVNSIAGLDYDQSQHKRRITEQIAGLNAGVDEKLYDYITSIKAAQAAAAARSRYSRSYGGSSSGRYSSGGSSGSYSGSRGSSLPSGSVKVPSYMQPWLARGRISPTQAYTMLTRVAATPYQTQQQRITGQLLVDEGRRRSGRGQYVK